MLGERQRFWDSSSGLRGNYKEIEDAMVAAGWFNDDGPEWIDETRFKQTDKYRHEGPCVIVIIHDVGALIDVDDLLETVIFP